MRGWTFLVILAVAASVCVQSAPTAQEAPEPGLPSSIGEETSGTGSIEGLVADSELVPVAAARVQVLRLTPKTEGIVELESDAEGRFIVRGLAAAQYGVAASRVGYETSTLQRVDVGPDETSRLSITLKALAVPTPFHETHILPGRSTVFAALIAPSMEPSTLTGLSNGGSEFRPILENETGPLQTHVLEMVWTDTSAACKAGFVPVLHGPTYNAGNPKAADTWMPSRTNPISPVRMVVTRDGDDKNAIHGPENTQQNGGEPLETSGRWLALMYSGYRGTLGTPADVACTFEQAFTIYWTVFFVKAAPTLMWSALPDV